ncbi:MULTISPECIES: hypothetical protein [Polymorphospora]|uniref:DUF779 domain-containing protein n=1 Tax=Polymorphospora lycopeni TaxID=3140240 RepID=A0ABV5CLN9_9ACTN
MTDDTGRALGDAEREILGAMLELPIRHGWRLRAEATRLRVRAVCGCGCPTVYFTAGPVAGTELVAEAEVAGTEGDVVLLFASEAGVDSLEYVWLGEIPPAGWPPAGSLVNLRVR